MTEEFISTPRCGVGLFIPPPHHGIMRRANDERWSRRDDFEVSMFCGGARVDATIVNDPTTVDGPDTARRNARERHSLDAHGDRLSVLVYRSVWDLWA